jgi:hypothetical protein
MLINHSRQQALKQIAITQNKSRPNYSGIPKESLEEYLSRGGKITKLQSNYKEISKRWAMPTNPLSHFGYTIYDRRV